MLASDFFVPKGYDVKLLETVDSTNEEAKRHYEKNGATDPTWFVALSQSAGHGRRGREWVSQEGNMFASLLVCPNVRAQKAAELSFITSLAVSDAIKNLSGIGMQEINVKWPNDVLIDGKKVAGILLEAVGNPENPSIIVGVGVNVAHHPDDVNYPTNDLQRIGGFKYLPSDVFVRMAEAFEFFYKFWQAYGFASVKRLWMAEAYGVGKTITVNLPSGSVEGVFEDLSDDGGLVLKKPDGNQEIIYAGDVFFNL